VPGLAEVQFHRGAESQLQDIREIPRHGRVGHVVALALHDVAGELRRRVRDGVGREEADVADEQAPDHWVLAGPDRGPPVPADPRPHLLDAGDPVRLAEELRGLRDPQPRRVAEEAPADQPVVRVMGLEEERLARRQDTELARTAGLPEIDLCHPRPVRQEPVPAVIGHPHIRPHTRYCAPPADPPSGNPAIARNLQTVDAQREAHGRRR
jgi:hypothetical protein